MPNSLIPNRSPKSARKDKFSADHWENGTGQAIFHHRQTLEISQLEKRKGLPLAHDFSGASPFSHLTLIMPLGLWGGGSSGQEHMVEHEAHPMVPKKRRRK